MFLLTHFLGVLILLILITVSWWFCIYFKYKGHLKEFKEVSAWASPINGSTTDLYTFLMNSIKMGRNFWMMLGPYPIFYTSDARLFSLILGSTKHINKSPFYGTLNRWFGNSLLTANGDTWRQQRRLLSPAFDYSLLVQNIDVTNEHVNQLINVIEDETFNESPNHEHSIDVCDLVSKFSLKHIYDTLLGTEINEDPSEIIAALHFFLLRSTERNMNVLEYFDLIYMLTPNYWKECKLLKYMNEHLRRIIKERQSVRKNMNKVHTKPIFIDIMIAELEINPTITEIDVIHQLLVIITAGFDTTAQAISFTLYALSRNPQIQENAYRDISSNLGYNPQEPITQKHISKMQYLDLVIKESMRIYPPAPVFSRRLQEDVFFGSTLLPKGLLIVFMPIAMHRDPDYYPEPDLFKPERFLEQNVNFAQSAYAPFSLGPRQCIAKRHGEYAVKIALAKILLHYEFVDVHHEMCLSSNITLSSKNGIRVGIKKRQVTTDLKR